mmetsp:Transcript_60997/g.108435  ORF Transcript_60997/g.108435 Transcript_60997/m.108435 type:complete len:133 (-) Transcript_60997:71-469(-)
MRSAVFALVLAITAVPTFGARHQADLSMLPVFSLKEDYSERPCTWETDDVTWESGLELLEACKSGKPSRRTSHSRVSGLGFVKLGKDRKVLVRYFGGADTGERPDGYIHYTVGKRATKTEVITNKTCMFVCN